MALASRPTTHPPTRARSPGAPAAAPNRLDQSAAPPNSVDDHACTCLNVCVRVEGRRWWCGGGGPRGCRTRHAVVRRLCPLADALRLLLAQACLRGSRGFSSTRKEPLPSRATKGVAAARRILRQARGITSLCPTLKVPSPPRSTERPSRGALPVRNALPPRRRPRPWRCPIPAAVTKLAHEQSIV